MSMSKGQIKKGGLSDTNLLLTITVVVFVVMYLCAVIFLGEGFRRPQTFLNLFNNNASLIIIACGLSLVMITGGIDISVGGVTALVYMSFCNQERILQVRTVSAGGNSCDC